MIQPVVQRERDAIVLMVEDNADHVFLCRESFEDSRAKVDLHHVDSGDKCMAFLRREPPYADAPRPDVVLLDIHMPRMDGYQVMEAISQDPALKSLTVVILTTSSELLDVNRMYALGCSSYITKPVDFSRFAAMVQNLTGYWFKLVVLPEER